MRNRFIPVFNAISEISDAGLNVQGMRILSDQILPSLGAFRHNADQMLGLSEVSIQQILFDQFDEEILGASP